MSVPNASPDRNPRIVRAVAVAAFLALGLLAFQGCGPGRKPDLPAQDGTLAVTLGRVKTLDPAMADDLASCIAAGHLYDRLLQYDYDARPYRLAPSLAEALPEIRDGGRTVVFRLRADARFAPHPCFAEFAGAAAAGGRTAEELRRVRPRDVIWSLLRLADGRLNAGGYWILRGKLEGLEEFHRRTAALPEGDFRPYEEGISGLREGAAGTVEFHLVEPYPQLSHVLAMTYAGILPEAAIRLLGRRLADEPAGGGPFLLEEWRRNYRLVLARNPDYRPERLPDGTVATLPRVERVAALMVQEPVTAWLLFLQGRLDQAGVPAENLETVVDAEGTLAPALRERGIRLERFPEYQINYIGFNARDPLLSGNLKLRQALSLAYDRDLRQRLFGRQQVPAWGPVPPGVEGYDQDFRNPFARHDLAAAKRLLAEAGYPDGRDPRTGQPLHLRFDLGGAEQAARRHAELLAGDFKALGIELEPAINSLPRLLEKLKRGDVQLFRLNWVGDYPDAQNFFQLFYGANAGGCNRAWYRNPEFDALYEKAAALPPGPERTRLYREMELLLTRDCPWIFESHPVTYRLVHSWVSGYIPHHFAYDGWKRVGLDAALRQKWNAGYEPVLLSPARPAP